VIVLPCRLGAPRPGWTRAADVVVIGSGIAGLTAVLHLRRELAASRVLLVTKANLDAGSTRWAQGGIAAALAAEDSPADHLADTLVAGVGLCDEGAAQVLVNEGPARVRELAELGARFDRAADGSFALTREGGHLRNRIIHAGGDATGLEVERALIAAVRTDPAIEVIENALVLDLLLDADGRAAGATLHVLGEGSRDGVGAVTAPSVVLATGGMGRSSPRRPTRACPPVTGWRSRCAPARSSPTWNSSSSIRPRCGCRRRRARRWSGNNPWSARRCAARARSSSTPRATG